MRDFVWCLKHCIKRKFILERRRRQEKTVYGNKVCDFHIAAYYSRVGNDCFLSVGLNNIGEFSLLVTALVAVTQILVLFLSMFSIVSTLYESKDTPFLNTLPLKPSSVFSQSLR